MMTIFDKEYDDVISGVVSSGYVTYKYAIEHLVPLIDRTEFQRKLQDRKFYKKLEIDILKGCVMPYITVAFVTDEINKNSETIEIKSFISKNISNSFVLDGIQRLNTLERIYKNTDLLNELNQNKKLYINFLFCANNDRLLYRMITLNNGQRPMTPRHQVEVMMSNLKIFDKYNIKFETEKGQTKQRDKRIFNKYDLIQGYIAYMANSPIIENKKIIEEKMDELIVSKIVALEADNENKFEDVLHAISRFQENEIILKWLKVTNNLIGFSVGMRKSAKDVLNASIEEVEQAVVLFDRVFANFSPSKIKIGKFRRELACDFFKNFNKYKHSSDTELLEFFIDETND